MIRTALFLLLTLSVQAAEVRVFAAASLTESLEEIAQAYERETNDQVLFNFGASSLLARQIDAGAPADLLLSADDVIRTTRLGERATFLSNALVIVARDARIRGPRDLVGKKVALAEPNTVPAGIYARTYLQKIGIWQKIKGNVVPTENVRGAWSAVVAGNVDAAIVYRTDAGIAKDVRIAYQVPKSDGPRIAYLFAMVKDAQPHARRFFAYLQSKRAKDIFAKHGFDVRR